MLQARQRHHRDEPCHRTAALRDRLSAPLALGEPTPEHVALARLKALCEAPARA